jgi:hypothetical protein
MGHPAAVRCHRTRGIWRKCAYARSGGPALAADGAANRGFAAGMAGRPCPNGRLLLGSHAPSRVIVDMVSPRRWTFSDIVKVFRRWMRWRDAPVVPVPAWASASLYKLGDAISWLGWRPPVRSTAQREMAYGAVGEILSPRQRDGGHSSSASVPHARSCTSLPAWSATRSMLWRPRPALCIAYG